MARLHRTVVAGEDLIQIWLDIASENPAAADRIYKRLDACTAPLRQFPELGPVRPDIAPDARMLVEAPYIVLYRIIGDVVQVVRVFHGRRHMDSALFEEGLEEPV